MEDLKPLQARSCYPTKTTGWLFRSMEKEYQAQVLWLAHRDTSFHFHPGKTRSARLVETKTENLGRQSQSLNLPPSYRFIPNRTYSDSNFGNFRVSKTCMSIVVLLFSLGLLPYGLAQVCGLPARIIALSRMPRMVLVL